ncbi:MAG: D-alanine--D-alanine ligase [Lachnospiraceae bacterium]|nr:D-alanine--D-alanine ligase [Lachnospiraceae bacterium]
MNRQVIAVLFGGQSSEHDISCISGRTVAGAIDAERYEVLLIGITREGTWLLAPSLASMEDGTWRESTTRAFLSPDASVHGVVILRRDGSMETRRVDVVFPVLHGLYGEDGTVQGVLELAGIPYVGCGVLASSVSMDKSYTKLVVAPTGIRQAAYLEFRKEETPDLAAAAEKVEAAFAYPVFIKPCNAGSSKGVSRAADRASLLAGLAEAFDNDRKILVEEEIRGREIECAVLGGHGAQASGVGEILAAGDTGFYDYDSKYFNTESQTVADPELPEGAAERVREAAVKIFRAVDGFGLARVDFFVLANGDVVFNEINTLPGFTAISMYPQLWAARGLALPQLVQKLIDLSAERYEKRRCGAVRKGCPVL